jgi:hypothetical protein
LYSSHSKIYPGNRRFWINTLNPKTPIPSFFISPYFPERLDRFLHRLKVKDLKGPEMTQITRCLGVGYEEVRERVGA